MHTKSLFTWLFYKICWWLGVLAIVITYWQSNQEFSNQLNFQEASLYQYVTEAMSHKEFSSNEPSEIKFSLINSQGNIVIDGDYGSLQSSLKSKDFSLALKGKCFVKKSSHQGQPFLVYWGRVEYDGKPHVLTAKVLGSFKYVSILIKNILVNLLLFLFAAYILSKRLAQPLVDFVEKTTEDIMSIEKELYVNGEVDVESIETNLLNTHLKLLNDTMSSNYQSLRKDVNQWQVFFSTIPRGLLAIDQERSIINCNQRALDMMSHKKDSKKRPIGDTVMSVFRNADLNNITKDFLESQCFVKEYEFEQTAAGEVETFKVIAVELTLENTTVDTGMLLIVENITGLRRLENMRRDFVANVSHELKTPIAIISGFVETLKDCLDDPENATRFLTIIENNVVRLSTIIDDLFSLSKLEQNESQVRQDFEKRPIEETIGAALNLCSYAAQEKNIELIANLEDSKYYKSKKMFANHRLLEQALRNLIENAIKYSPEKTTIEIKSQKSEENIIISVKDSGPGIADEHQEKVFERFYRIDKSRDRQTGGSGLGLAIVKHILRIHHGQISLESVEGEGCEFIMTLPYTS
jgi:two-component system, OmpR family, phosphate regulon sensor histidine kinase PhoR